MPADGGVVPGPPALLMLRAGDVARGAERELLVLVLMAAVWRDREGREVNSLGPGKLRAVLRRRGGWIVSLSLRLGGSPSRGRLGKERSEDGGFRPLERSEEGSEKRSETRSEKRSLLKEALPPERGENRPVSPVLGRSTEARDMVGSSDARDVHPDKEPEESCHGEAGREKDVGAGREGTGSIWEDDCRGEGGADSGTFDDGRFNVRTSGIGTGLDTTTGVATPVSHSVASDQAGDPGRDFTVFWS